MAQGQHTARLAVKGDTRNASKELGNLAKRERALQAELDGANRKLLAHGKAHDRVAESAKRAANQTQKTALAAHKAEQMRASSASAQLQADNARRSRERLEASGPATKANVAQRIAAIEREKVARLQLVAVELRSAKSVSEAYAAQNRAQQIQHDAHIKRMQAQSQAMKKTGGGAKGGGGGIMSTLGGLGGIAGVATGAAFAMDQVADRVLRFDTVAANLPFSIDRARISTKGLVTDFDLMKAAVTANRLGVVKTDEEFASLADSATKLALSMGGDANQAVGDLSTALSRGSSEILDNLGIQLKLSDAYRIYASQLGKTASELTDVEKKQAFMVVGMQKAKEAADKATVSVEGWAGTWAQAKTTLINAADSVWHLDDALEELSEETLRTFGYSGREAAYATDRLGDAAEIAGRVGLAGITLGGSEAAIAIYNYATKQDKATDTVKRGIVEMGPFGRLIYQQATWTERAAMAWDLYRNNLKQYNDEQALTNEKMRAELASLEEQNRYKLERERRDKIDATEKQNDKARKERQRAADEKRRELREQRTSEAEYTVASARREYAEIDRLHTRGLASYAELLEATRTLHTAENELAIVQFETASGRAESLRAGIALQDLELDQRHALLDLAEQEATAERDRARAAQEALRTGAAARLDRSAALGGASSGVSNARALGAAGVADARVFGGSRGKDTAGALAQEQAAQALAREVSINDERRRMKATELAEDRDYYTAQLADARTASQARIELARIEQETAGLAHAARMDALRVQDAAEQASAARAIKQAQERAQRFRAAQQEAIGFARGMAQTSMSLRRTEQTSIEAARASGASEAEARRQARGASLISLGEQLAGQAVGHGAQAIADFATFNYVGGAGHTAAAAALGIGSGVLLARGASMGGGSRGLAGGGPTPSMDPGGGGSANAGSYDHSPIPPSPNPTAPMGTGNPSGGPAPIQSAPTSGQTSVNNVTINAWGSIDRDVARELVNRIDEVKAAG